jgi:hypothetical protein
LRLASKQHQKLAKNWPAKLGSEFSIVLAAQGSGKLKVTLRPSQHPIALQPVLRFAPEEGCMASSSLSASPLFSRRDFLGRTTQCSALLAAYQFLQLPALAESLAGDFRVANTNRR